MPKPNKQRGRRMKRKHEDDPEEPVEESSSKRRKSLDATTEQEYLPLEFQEEDMSAAYPAEKAFFGMLDESEQEFFKKSEQQLDEEEFETPEEKVQFIDGFWRAMDGKELKVAHSQSCSRVMERFIRIATVPQLKNLFQQFSGNFIHLISHRFASHCCEALFTCAAPFVSQELREPTAQAGGSNPDDIYVSMENLFLHTVAELEGNVGFLLTDPYASHALRFLLLILSGKPISTEPMKGLLQSKRKEGGSSRTGSKAHAEATSKERPVPDSFNKALEKLIGDSVAGLDTDKLRALATHTNANPTLQLLLTLELSHYGKQRAKDEKSIIRKLLPDEPFTAECESAAFIGGMVHDPIGSHLVEKIIESAPSKLFKSLYFNFFKERLASYARHETGTYVDCRLIERLGYDDLLDAHEILCPVLPSLLQKHWTSLTRTLIERCTVRDIDTQAIAVVIEESFRGPNGFDVLNMLKIDINLEAIDVKLATVNPDGTAHMTAAFFKRPDEGSKVHFNILAQAMLIVPGSLSALILDSMILLDTPVLIQMAKDHIATRTLQQALTTKNASMIQRRKLVQRFYGNIGDMALDKSASHVVDCIWEGTHGLAFIRERIAEELAENEAALRESACGRAVWRNWKMEIYKRKRPEWIRQSKIKASNDGFQSFSELDVRKRGDAVQKTPLQLARERHMQEKAKKSEKSESADKTEKADKEKKEKKKDKKDKSASRSSRSSNSVVAGPSGPARTPAAAAS